MVTGSDNCAIQLIRVQHSTRLTLGLAGGQMQMRSPSCSTLPHKCPPAKLQLPFCSCLCPRQSEAFTPATQSPTPHDCLRLT
eukprot:6397175-Amphidinium_carterae.2